MIVATRPDPTVLPPSRFVGNIITMLFHIFHWILCLYSSISAVLFEVFKFFRTKIEPRICTTIKIEFQHYFHISNALTLLCNSSFDKLSINACFSLAISNTFPNLCIASTVKIILFVGTPKIAYSS